MRNPFRTEEEAFRFVWLTILYLALIVIGSVIEPWLGLGIFIGETAVLLWTLVTRREQREEPVERQAPPAHTAGEHRILVVANETVGGDELLSLLRRRGEGAAARGEHLQVLVVCPALNSPLKHWLSDEDGARQAAQARLERSLAAMRAAGIDARGQIGDGDPLQASEDAIRTFAPDEVVVSTHPEGRSNWLERGVVEATRERFAVPVTHVVVDLEQVGETAAPAGGAVSA